MLMVIFGAGASYDSVEALRLDEGRGTKNYFDFPWQTSYLRTGPSSSKR